MEIIDNALIEAIDLGLALLLQLAIPADGTKQPCGKRSVDALEELEEDKRDGVAGGQQPVSAGVRKFSTRALALNRS